MTGEAEGGGDRGARGLHGDPFATSAMAGLLERQGHLEEAARVCRAVLARDPEDRKAREILDRVTGPGSREPRSLPEAELERIEARWTGEGLEISWSLSQAADRLGRSAVGRSGRRVVRVMEFGPRRAGEPRVRDLGIGDLEGELALDTDPDSLVSVCALGWLDEGGRFVPIVHSRPVRVS